MNLSLSKAFCYIIILSFSSTAYSSNWQEECKAIFTKISNLLSSKTDESFEMSKNTPLNNQTSNEITLEKFIENRVRSKPLMDAIMSLEENATSAHEKPVEVINRIESKLKKIVEKKNQASKVFTENLNTQAFIDAFISYQQSLYQTEDMNNPTPILIESLQLYINDAAFREWFYKLRTLDIFLVTILSNPTLHIPEFIMERHNLITEAQSPSWNEFYEAYNKNTSVTNWISYSLPEFIQKNIVQETQRLREFLQHKASDNEVTLEQYIKDIVENKQLLKAVKEKETTNDLYRNDAIQELLDIILHDKHKWSKALKEIRDTQVIIDNFRTQHPQIDDTMTQSLQLFVNDSSLREWFFQLEVLDIFSDLNIKEFEEKTELLLKEAKSPSWNEFYDNYRPYFSDLREFIRLMYEFIVSVDAIHHSNKNTDSQNISLAQ